MNQGKRKKNDDDSDGETTDQDDGSPPKKKHKGGVKGFNDNEIRRFIKSYKKFPQPLTRMEDIAKDAELEEKALHELVELGRLLRQTCETALENEAAAAAAAAAGGGGGGEDKKGAVKIGGVVVSAKKLMETEGLLRPLGKVMSEEKKLRLAWSLQCGTKDANFDVDWGTLEDSRLLSGVYEYGLGNWEDIKVSSIF